jgi:hypothetical protein
MSRAEEVKFHKMATHLDTKVDKKIQGSPFAMLRLSVR